MGKTTLTLLALTMLCACSKDAMTCGNQSDGPLVIHARRDGGTTWLRAMANDVWVDSALAVVREGAWCVMCSSMVVVHR